MSWTLWGNRNMCDPQPIGTNTLCLDTTLTNIGERLVVVRVCHLQTFRQIGLPAVLAPHGHNEQGPSAAQLAPWPSERIFSRRRSCRPNVHKSKK